VGGLNIGHLYQILDRLSRDGLIESQRQPQQVKPDRLIHRPPRPAAPSSTAGSVSQPSPPAATATDFFLKIMAAVRSAAPATLPRRAQPAARHLLRQLHALADARAVTSTTAVDSLLITAAELHIRADLGVVDAAEKTLTASEQSSPGMTARRAQRASPGRSAMTRPDADAAPTSAVAASSR